jgi:hypothetical protein
MRLVAHNQRRKQAISTAAAPLHFLQDKGEGKSLVHNYLDAYRFANKFTIAQALNLNVGIVMFSVLACYITRG